MDDDTTHEKQTIDLTVSEPNAVEKAQQMLGAYDIDEEDVTRISIEVYEDDSPIPVGDADAVDLEKLYPDQQTATNGTTGRRLSESDRKLSGVRSDTRYHLILSTVSANDGDAGITSREISDKSLLGGMAQNNVSSALSALYRRKLLDREKDGNGYRYWTTDYGEAELDDIGRDIVPEDVGLAVSDS